MQNLYCIWGGGGQRWGIYKPGTRCRQDAALLFCWLSWGVKWFQVGWYFLLNSATMPEAERIAISLDWNWSYFLKGNGQMLYFHNHSHSQTDFDRSLLSSVFRVLLVLAEYNFYFSSLIPLLSSTHITLRNKSAFHLLFWRKSVCTRCVNVFRWM